jgi:hypothetical protein
MSARRLVLVSVGACVVLVVVVLIGRWEADRRAETQSRGMARMVARVGSLDDQTLDAFRYLGAFQCLVYGRNGNPVALELCVDSAGRVVETIDRTGPEPRIWSLRDDPERSTVRVDRAEVDRLLRMMGISEYLIDLAHQRGSS